MYHQRFAGNCIESPGEQCFANGLGPASFDCSGFVLRALQDVTGSDISLFSNVRHVRDMWQAASTGVGPFRATEWAAGHLVVMRRRYTVNGMRTVVPGHIGIVTDAATLNFIHANPSLGKVEERPLRTTHTILGGIAIDL